MSATDYVGRHRTGNGRATRTLQKCLDNAEAARLANRDATRTR